MAAQPWSAADLRNSFIVDQKIHSAYVRGDFRFDLGNVPVGRRRMVLTREQEFAYIRADLVRLTVVAVLLLVVLIIAMFILR